ncbi:glycoside hydrolase family 5 protein [Rhizoctonia solani AG-3 Rhs1AP]|uniref:Glycoside hydrolase family 5 protein n=2 Tax=Rhizoctonia solani AG-3 TaxID=1086053 RepID=A0A074SAP5_9AGAM|nr:glycoside hydrolase family 5 protein [Rhizoctonia solani AG-3 Rhs1AP]KEP53968.1 glycoside hydrolase family 5 protein [Rhizoctonia solani 123E]
MDALFKKVTGKIDKEISDMSDRFGVKFADKAPTHTSGLNVAPLSQRDVFRFRKQRGINIGSWFVQERWLCESTYCGCGGGQSDLHIAQGANGKGIMEHHWDTWIIEGDWGAIQAQGFNTVRLPIGYYHLSGIDPSVLDDTDFGPYKHIFSGAWVRILRAIGDAERYGLGVLIDLHAAPGAQNRDAHSGTGTGEVRMWTRTNLSRTVHALQVLTAQLALRPNVVGIELVNEPANNNQVQKWYEDTLTALRKISPDLPLYISDAWDAPWYSKIVGSRSDFVVLDHHLYRCFTPGDASMSGDEHASALRNSAPLVPLSAAARGNLIVGEWSAALNPASLRSNEAGEQDRQRRVWARAQLDAYEASCGGWFFWTWKKGTGWDAGWCAKDASLAAILPAWVGGRRKSEIRRIPSDPGWKRQAQNGALDQHKNYWASRGTYNELWRFGDGYSTGWDDAILFLTFNDNGPSVSELGFRGEWLKRRIADHIRVRGKSENIWEFEHGFNQGFDAAWAGAF